VAEPDLKPRTIGELLDAAFTVYRHDFVRLLLAAVIVSIPAVLLAALTAREVAEAMRDAERMMQKALVPNTADPLKPLQTVFSAYGKLAWPSLLAIVLQAISRAGAALMMAPVAAAAIRREACPSLGTTLRATLPRLAPAILLELVFDFSFSTSIFCCPPLGFVGIVLAAAPALLVLEKGRLETRARAAMPGFLAALVAPFAACIDVFARGARLSWSASAIGRSLGYVGALIAFVWVFTAAVTLPLSLTTKDSGHWFWVQHCAEIPLLPVLGIGRALWYFDLRARREGADLEPAG
jgi:hypothetical protein